MRLDHLLSKEEEVRVARVLKGEKNMFFFTTGFARADPANKFGGGDALMGNTRSHPEHDG